MSKKKEYPRVRIMDNFYLIYDKRSYVVEEEYMTITKPPKPAVHRSFYGTVYQALKGLMHEAINVGTLQEIEVNLERVIQKINQAEEEIKSKFRIEIIKYI